jgi:hypothetical protein
LKVIVPRGTSTLTLSRMAWLNDEAAQWELWEFEQSSEELMQRDANDQGNLRTRLVHLPDEQAARERFAAGIELVMQLVPVNEHDRVEQRLRNTAELAFLLHGLEFARVRIGLAPNSFAQTLEVTAGVGPKETPLTAENRAQLTEMVAELFARRRAAEPSGVFAPGADAAQDWFAHDCLCACAHAGKAAWRHRHGHPGSALSRRSRALA